MISKSLIIVIIFRSRGSFSTLLPGMRDILTIVDKNKSSQQKEDIWCWCVDVVMWLCAGVLMWLCGYVVMCNQKNNSDALFREELSEKWRIRVRFQANKLRVQNLKEKFLFAVSSCSDNEVECIRFKTALDLRKILLCTEFLHSISWEISTLLLDL